MTTAGPDDGKFRPTKARPTKSGGGRGWFGAAGVVVIIVAAVGLLLYMRSGDDDGSPAIGDHIHAAFGVNVCGQFLPDIPAFATRVGTETSAGLHSHGDGLIHIHPEAEDETGDAATVGRYLDYAGGDVSEDSITMIDGTTFTSGDPCPDGRPGVVRWSVNGEEQDGNPGDLKPDNLDVVVIGFLPEGDDLGEPASAAIVSTPSDT